MAALGKHHALRMLSCSGMKGAREFCLLSEELPQVLFILVPVGNDVACHTTFDSSLGHSRADLGDKTWVDGLGDEVFGAESEVVDVINFVDDVRYRLLG